MSRVFCSDLNAKLLVVILRSLTAFRGFNVAHRAMQGDTMTDEAQAAEVALRAVGGTLLDEAHRPGFLIQMPSEERVATLRSRPEPGAVASPSEAPTIRIVTSSAPQAQASFAPPFAFPGFSRGFSTVGRAKISSLNTLIKVLCLKTLM